MENLTGTCPGCHKHCDLSAPRCRVGKVFARTGVLPGKKHKKEAPPSGPVLQDPPGNPAPPPAAAASFDDEALAERMRGASRAIRHGKGSLAALSDGERAQLNALMDKLYASWTEAAPPERPGDGADEKARRGHKKHGRHRARG